METKSLTKKDGRRVLGAMDDLTIKWEGEFRGDDKEDNVIAKAKRCVLRKLGLSHSRMMHVEPAELHELLHMPQCPLISLDVSQCYALRAPPVGRSTVFPWPRRTYD